MAPFESMHLNVDGVEDYTVRSMVQTFSTSVKVRVHSNLSVDQHWMSLRKQWKERYLNARRKWRDGRMAALAINSKDLA